MRKIENAIIKSTKIGIERGVLTLWLVLDYDGACQCFGGYVLYLPRNYDNPNGHRTGHCIYRILETVGVSNWSDLEGKTVRVDSNLCGVYGIGHIVKDIWFYPDKEFNNEEV